MTDSDDPTSAVSVPHASVVARPGSTPIAGPEAQLFTELLDGSLVELMRAYGFDAVVADYRPERLGNTTCLAAFIGFGGQAVKGALTVVVPRSLLEETHPTNTAAKALTDSDAGDWCCEFVNQLLGRMKNKAVRRHLSFQATMPQSILSDRLRIVEPVHGGLIVRNYQMKKFELLVCLDMMVDAALLLPESNTSVPEVATEGDCVLF